MKLSFPNLLDNEKPITSTEQYLELINHYDSLTSESRSLSLHLMRQREQGQKESVISLQKLTDLSNQEDQIRSELSRRLPYVPVSCCPFCKTLIWMEVPIFSLRANFWYNNDSGLTLILKEARCDHLFCVDGALNLNGHTPTEAYHPRSIVTNAKIWMAAEIPFVKPRVLNLRTMVAVVHSLPIAEKYTAYPIGYFTEQQPDIEDFCIGWADTEYLVYTGHRGPGGGPIMMTGKRRDAQDYELEKWITLGKLYWLGSEDQDYPLLGEPLEDFPYGNISGRRHPYTIKNGRVRNLSPRTRDSKPNVYYEY